MRVAPRAAKLPIIHLVTIDRNRAPAGDMLTSSCCSRYLNDAATRIVQYQINIYVR